VSLVTSKSRTVWVFQYASVRMKDCIYFLSMVWFNWEDNCMKSGKLHRKQVKKRYLGYVFTLTWWRTSLDQQHNQCIMWRLPCLFICIKINLWIGLLMYFTYLKLVLVLLWPLISDSSVDLWNWLNCYCLWKLVYCIM